MRSKIFILLFITSQLFANVECYNLDDYVDDGEDLTELTKIISQKAEYDARNSQGEEYLVGGMTCAWPNISTYQKYEEINRTNLADEYIKIVVKYEITSKTTLGDNDHLTVKKGYVFPNGHITTSEEEGMFDKHENGHEFYNRCIKFEEISKKGQFECTIKLNAEWSQKEKDEALRNAIANELKIIEIPLIEDKVNETQNKIDAMVYRFHKDHGVGGSSDNYTCPTN